jgi:hypothetical protein
MAKVWKAQWPMAAPWLHILIYEAGASSNGREEFLLAATPRARRELFHDKYVKVFFEGDVAKDATREMVIVKVERFVRRSEWA